MMLSVREAQRLRREVGLEETELTRIFSALGDESRYRAWQLLLSRGDLCVTEIARVLGVSVPAASQQLKILETAGLVERERNGQMTCYRLPDHEPVVRMLTRLVQMAQLKS